MTVKAKDILTLVRPQQYVKNIFIFLPVFFGQKITHLCPVLNALYAFAAFSLAASGCYVLNDILDRNEDRLHPEKRFRPVASGAVSPSQALLVMWVFLLAGFLSMSLVSLKATAILFGYVAMNVAYSCFLKHLAIVDITILAIGFVLRLFVGSTVTGISLSTWIIIMTFLLALFLALAKRRDDVLIFEKTGNRARSVVDGYNLRFLDVAIGIMASVVVVAYTIYTTSSDVMAKAGSRHLYLTALFVILGVLRYLQLAFVFEDSGSPTRLLLKDRFIQLTLAGWFLTFTWILYF
jgi:4-hydroxybenzoate polyprenyltransferase